MVQLKQYLKGTEEHEETHFNSIMVQLKLANFHATICKLDIFQFHNGTIKTYHSF